MASWRREEGDEEAPGDPGGGHAMPGGGVSRAGGGDRDRAVGNDARTAPAGARRRTASGSASLLARFLEARRRGGGPAAGRADGARGRLRAALARDLEEGRGLPLASLAVVFGIAGYFALPAEPLASVVTGLSLLLLGLAGRLRRRGRSAVILLLAGLLLGGAAAGALRTRFVAAPVLDRPRSLTVSGFVEEVERQGTGLRLTMRVSRAEHLSAARTPYRARVTLRGPLADPAPRVGEAVSLRARLMPPPDAVMPGGYDFAFRAYFDRIGATGFAFAPPRGIDLGPPPVRLRVMAALADLRGEIAARIGHSLGRDTVAGALAVALIVGDRSAIPDGVTDVLRASGLAHILAISGLHMALFSGAVFFVVRAGLAVSRALADTRPIDLWAAGAALAAATFYLAISGASVATQRAFVMTLLVLAGRMAGRRALTMRNAALAALVILLPAPESLLDPGFQMSFAAVVALIAAYEGLRRHMLARDGRTEPGTAGPAVQLLAGAGRWIGAILLTSLVAGLATGAIGAFHFHRVAPLGPLVNLLAMPLVTLVVMPCAVLALALLPFGLEILPLTLMGATLDKVVAIASWADERTPGEGVVGAPSFAAILAFVAAGALLCLAPAGARRIAVLPLGLAVLLQALHRQPDMLVSSDGTVVALRDETGRLRVTARPGSFLADVWLRAEGIPAGAHGAHALPKGAMACDRLGCVAHAHPPPVADGAGGRSPPAALVVALGRVADALVEDCARADILVTPLQAPPDCAARLVLDGPRLAREGAVALWFDAVTPVSRLADIADAPLSAAIADAPLSAAVDAGAPDTTATATAIATDAGVADTGARAGAVGETSVTATGAGATGVAATGAPVADDLAAARSGAGMQESHAALVGATSVASASAGSAPARARAAATVPDDINPESAAPDSTGPDSTGPERTGPDGVDPDRAHPESADPDGAIIAGVTVAGSVPAGMPHATATRTTIIVATIPDATVRPTGATETGAAERPSGATAAAPSRAFGQSRRVAARSEVPATSPPARNRITIRLRAAYPWPRPWTPRARGATPPPPALSPSAPPPSALSSLADAADVRATDLREPEFRGTTRLEEQDMPKQGMTKRTWTDGTWTDGTWSSRSR